MDRVTLAHLNEKKILCVYTDSSGTDWSGMVTQLTYDDGSLTHSAQRHVPLELHSGHSGRFDLTQMGWSTTQKEAYAMLASVERSHWLTACPSCFEVYFDNNDIIFIFDPTTLMQDIGQRSLRKVVRWAVQIAAYTSVCYHIS